MSDRVVIGYMDKVDWDHELGEASGGNKVYPSVENLKSCTKCWDECGIVEVEVRLRSVILESDFFGRRDEGINDVQQTMPPEKGNDGTGGLDT